MISNSDWSGDLKAEALVVAGFLACLERPYCSISDHDPDTCDRSIVCLTLSSRSKEHVPEIIDAEGWEWGIGLMTAPISSAGS